MFLYLGMFPLLMKNGKLVNIYHKGSSVLVLNVKR